VPHQLSLSLAETASNGSDPAVRIHDAKLFEQELQPQSLFLRAAGDSYHGAAQATAFYAAADAFTHGADLEAAAATSMSKLHNPTLAQLNLAMPSPTKVMSTALIAPLHQIGTELQSSCPTAFK